MPAKKKIEKKPEEEQRPPVDINVRDHLFRELNEALTASVQASEGFTQMLAALQAGHAIEFEDAAMSKAHLEHALNRTGGIVLLLMQGLRPAVSMAPLPDEDEDDDPDFDGPGEPLEEEGD